MRYIILLVVFASCSEVELKKCHYCYTMTISDATPIQFWLNGQETFNESPECGLTQVCFCQPFNCTDELAIQFEDDSGTGFVLDVVNSEGEILEQISFEEISDGTFYLSFTPSEYGICEKVQLKIKSNTPESAWTTGTSAADNTWTSITYGNGLFVAVSESGSGNRVMTSSDGVSWTSRTSAADNSWKSVTYGNGLFVAVSSSGSGNRVMTSPDGINWTIQTSAANAQWQDVVWASDLNLFVAVASTGGTSNVMTSPDGITWTLQTSANGNTYQSIAYGEGLLVAVSLNGTTASVMTSINGTSWTSRTTLTDGWTEVVYGAGRFVAVGTNGVMYSLDGINWNSGTEATNHNWAGLAFNDSIFVAVSVDGTSMKSINGNEWSSLTVPTANQWASIATDGEVFVSVSANGTGDRVMVLETVYTEVASSDCIDLRNNHQCSKLISYTNAKDFDGINYEGISPQPVFYLRIPANWTDQQNPQTQEDLELSNGVIVTLRQTIQKKRELSIGYIPDYMHYKIQTILMHDTIIIDGLQWKRRDGYEAPKITDYPLKKGTVLLTIYNSVLKNTI